MKNNNSYISFEIRNKKGLPVYWGTAPASVADEAILSAWRVCREVASYVTSREVTIEEELEAEEASGSSPSFLEATLLASNGDFVMRVYFSSEEEYVQEIASLLKACPSAVSVSVREVN